MAGRGTDIKLDPALNEEIARNCANWLKSEVAKGNEIKLHVHSEYEYNLIMKELQGVIN